MRRRRKSPDVSEHMCSAKGRLYTETECLLHKVLNYTLARRKWNTSHKTSLHLSYACTISAISGLVRVHSISTSTLSSVPIPSIQWFNSLHRYSAGGSMRATITSSKWPPSSDFKSSIRSYYKYNFVYNGGQYLADRSVVGSDKDIKFSLRVYDPRHYNVTGYNNQLLRNNSIKYSTLNKVIIKLTGCQNMILHFCSAKFIYMNLIFN